MYISEFVEKNRDREISQYKKEKAKIIYFICENNGEIIYIGKTVNIISRMQVHGVFHSSFIGRFSKKDIFYFTINENEDCDAIEQALILEIQPKYNIRGLPCEKLGKTKVNTYHIPKVKPKPKSKDRVNIIASKKEVKKLIKLCGGSRKKAAKTANIAYGYIYRIEKGLRPSMRLYDAILRLCEELEVKNANNN